MELQAVTDVTLVTDVTVTVMHVTKLIKQLLWNVSACQNKVLEM